MTGYIRNDVTDQIANGNTIDAAPLDGEFNAVQAAFAAVGGHSHGGAIGEGAPITVVGPTQDVVVSGVSVTPKTDNTIDLGAPTLEWKDLYVDGVANIDSLVADTADINGGTVDATVIGGTTPAAVTATTLAATSATVGGDTVTTNTAVQTLTNKTINLGNNTLVATSAQVAAAVTDETGSGALVFATSPALAGVPTAPTAAAGTNTTQLATTAHVFAERSNTATLTNKTLTSPAINGGSITGITDLAIADGGTGASDAATARTNLGFTGAVTSIVTSNLATDRLLVSDGSGKVAASSVSSSHYVPSGGIIMWSGAVVNIPTGWVLCDGLNGTPDLRGRFIVGAGGAYAVGATGGAETVALSEANLPSHTHTFSGTTSTTTGLNGNFSYRTLGFGASGIFTQQTINDAGARGSVTGNDDYGRTSMNVNHDHTFSGTTNATGSGTAHENRPPYYALCYIMKT